MSQKAICPRGHIWDPSTVAGLPPTATPRCPICGEEEPPRVSNLLPRLKRWLRNNLLLAGLIGLCLLFSVALIVMIVQARSSMQAAHAEAEKARFAAGQALAKLHWAPRAVEAADNEQQSKRQTTLQAERWQEREKEFATQLRQVEKTASDARRQRDEQFQQRKLAEELAQTAEQVRQQALSGRAEAARQLVKMYTAAGSRLMESGDLSASLLWFTEALRLAEKEKLPTQTHRLRLAYVLTQCPRPVQMRLHEKKLNVVRLSSDGKRVLMAGADGTLEVWDAASGKRIGEVLALEEAVAQAAFSPDGKKVLTAASDMKLHLWDVETSAEVFTPLQLKGPVVGLAFSADGKRFLSVTDKPPPMDDKSSTDAAEVELRIWDVATGDAVREEALGSEIRARPAAFSPDGKRVLTLCQDRCARIWDIATGKQSGSSFAHAAELVQASYSADGALVLTASVDGTARIWVAKTGEPVTPFLKHGSALRGASLSADGKYALTFGDNREVRVWDVSKGEAAGPALRHTEAVSNALFSPDGRCVLTTCADGAARIWEYTSGQEILPALRHGEPIRYAAFTAAGDGLLTLAGQAIRLWDLTLGDPVVGWVERSEAHREGLPHAQLEVFSPDGKLVLRATETTVRVYDTKTNQAVGGTLPHKNKVSAAAFSPDGKRVLTVCHERNGDELEGHVRIWETATGDLLGQPLVHPRSVLEASFNRDGRRVVTACQDGKARLWNVKENSLVGEPMEHKQDLSRALFLPDGKRILTVDVEGGLRLWDADTAEAVGPTWGHRKPIHHLSFSADGQQLVTASEDGTASVWEANTGREIATTPVQGAPILQATFSSDGKRIATVSGDQRVRVWEATNSKPISPPLRHRSVVLRAAFSKDGKRIVTAAADGLRVFDATNGEPISPLLRTPVVGSSPHPPPHPTSISGSSIAENRPAAELMRVAELLNAERMSDAGEMVPLDRAELSKVWQDVHEKYGKEFAPSPQRLAAWHHRGAEECEQQHLWIGALRHLDYLINAAASADLYARRGRTNRELHRWQAAKSDYTQALAGDASRWDLLAGRAEAEAALGRRQEAEADYSKAIERKSDRAELWSARGRLEAERGDWRKAAADLGKAIHLGEQDASVWRQHTLALLAGGDEANYRRWCARLVQRFGASKDDAVFRNVVWTVALTDGTVRDWKPLVGRAEQAVKANPHSADPQRLLAALLYRSGQFSAAQKHLQEALASSRTQPTARDALLMALAAQRLGRGEEAKKWLAQAEQIHRDRAKDDKEPWEDRLIYETHHREVSTLMKGS